MARKETEGEAKLRLLRQIFAAMELDDECNELHCLVIDRLSVSVSGRYLPYR